MKNDNFRGLKGPNGIKKEIGIGTGIGVGVGTGIGMGIGFE